MLKTLETEKTRRLTEEKLRFYAPYRKQREFHDAGATHRERLLCAANQVGKTYAAAMELAAHATGQYPGFWCGYRFDRAIRAWAAGETAEVVRATIQRTHFAAFCECWWDRDLDIFYLVRTLRLREQTPLQHVEPVLPRTG